MNKSKNSAFKVLFKILFIFLIAIQQVGADETQDTNQTNQTNQTNAMVESTVFPVSTEMQIGKIRNLLDRAPQGIMLTVGAERAFREASMFDKIESLIVLDLSPDIIRFNTINVILLKAENKETYKNLRWIASFEDWQKLDANLTQEDFAWWENNVRNIRGYSMPEELNRYGSNIAVVRFLTLRKQLMSIYPSIADKFNREEKKFLEEVTWQDIEKFNPKDKTSKNYISKEIFDGFVKERKTPKSCVYEMIDHPEQAIDIGKIIDYKSGNYLFDDTLYNRLHNLALQNKIIIMKADLTNLEDLETISKKIKGLNSILAVLDLDNLYATAYMGEEKFRTALSKLTLLGIKNSMLILMHNYKNFACAQYSIYIGFTFENVENWPKDIFFARWIDNFPPDLYPLIDGRLYESKETLPEYLRYSY